MGLHNLVKILGAEHKPIGIAFLKKYFTPLYAKHIYLW